MAAWNQRLVAGLFCVALIGFVPGARVTAADFMFRANVKGEAIEGKPIAWSKEQMLLLGRDGRLHDFHPKEATEARKTSLGFAPYPPAQMRAALQKEFGNAFEVSTTNHYLVVHPHGQESQWAERFEQLYKRFQQYFRIRGFSLREPDYPLVAIVFRNEGEYFRHAEKSGSPMQPGTLGHYDPVTNRVFLFDVTSNAPGADWSSNAATIIHEATHQTAYNTGIHQRFIESPRWLLEGLATMFEARGVWNGRSSDMQSDRVNRERLMDFRSYAKTRRGPDSLVTLLSSDQRFKGDAIAAYAEAWALSFYLSETQPRLYAQYLAKTANRPPLSLYPAAERVADFQDVFGRELKVFDAKFLRYMEELK